MNSRKEQTARQEEDDPPSGCGYCQYSLNKTGEPVKEAGSSFVVINFLLSLLSSLKSDFYE